MSKRPAFDLSELTAEAAAPMQEATQRTAKPALPQSKPRKGREPQPVPTADLEPLAFKVPPVFRRRFKRCALDANIKLNELLFQALDAWEAAQKH
jgi:hypothetical protein